MRPDAKSLCDFVDGQQSGIALAALNATDVRAVYFHEIGKGLLREAFVCPKRADTGPKLYAHGWLGIHGPQPVKLLLDSLQTMSSNSDMSKLAAAASARPFLKWAGGKQALAAKILEEFPPEFERYYEPFLGGGSLFFALAPERAVLSDRNEWLIDTYAAVRDCWKDVAAILDSLPNSKADFLRIRRISPATLGTARRAAYFIYLNKTCFRGLFRVNQKGGFNVPYGAYQRRYYSPEELEEAAAALSGVELRKGDFESGLEGAVEGDFIYFDPPYYKLGGYSDFNRYTADQFREQHHIRLAALCRELDARGIRWAVSNSDTAFVRELYSGFQLCRIEARREINLLSARRSVTELLIKNY